MWDSPLSVGTRFTELRAKTNGKLHFSTLQNDRSSGSILAGNCLVVCGLPELFDVFEVGAARRHVSGPKTGDPGRGRV